MNRITVKTQKDLDAEGKFGNKELKSFIEN